MLRAPRCFTTWRKGDNQGNQDEKATPRVAHSHCGKTAPAGGECVEGALRKGRESHLHAGLGVGRTGRTLWAQWC